MLGFKILIFLPMEQFLSHLNPERQKQPVKSHALMSLHTESPAAWQILPLSSAEIAIESRK